MREIHFTTTEIDATEGRLLTHTRAHHVSSIIDFFFGRVGDYLFGVVPPRGYLNEFMRLGSIDGQFDGRRVLFEWQPCELSEMEYAEVTEGVSKLPGQPFKVVVVPNTVKTKAEFDHWAFVRSLGPPP